MPTPTGRAGLQSGGAAGYVKLSDKLTTSLNDITRMIEEHKG